MSCSCLHSSRLINIMQASSYIRVKKLFTEAGVGIYPGEKIKHRSRCWDISGWKSCTLKQVSVSECIRVKSSTLRQVSGYIRVKKLYIEAGIGIYPGGKVIHWGRRLVISRWKVIHRSRHRNISRWKGYTLKQVLGYIRVNKLSCLVWNFFSVGWLDC